MHDHCDLVDRATEASGPRGPGPAGPVSSAALALVGSTLSVVYGLFISPPDAQLGETIRIIYMHVPTVMAAYVAFIITAVSSAMYLWKRTEFWDLLGASAAEIGVLFFAVTIVDGALWGKVTWGVFWRWEPRLTTSAVLLLMYIGYLAVRSIPADTSDPGDALRGHRSGGGGQHPDRAQGRRLVAGPAPGPHRVGHDRPRHGRHPAVRDVRRRWLPGLLVFAWLLIHRFRVAYLTERAADVGLDDAIAERRAEGVTDMSTTGYIVLAWVVTFGARRRLRRCGDPSRSPAVGTGRRPSAEVDVNRPDDEESADAGPIGGPVRTRRHAAHRRAHALVGRVRHPQVPGHRRRGRPARRRWGSWCSTG